MVDVAGDGDRCPDPGVEEPYHVDDPVDAVDAGLDPVARPHRCRRLGRPAGDLDVAAAAQRCGPRPGRGEADGPQPPVDARRLHRTTLPRPRARHAGATLPSGSVATEDDVRRIALSLPETKEKPWYGAPGFRVKDKGFLRIRSEAEGALVVFVADVGEKEALLASDPQRFFTTAHYDGYPIVLVNLPMVEVGELTELITESWRLKAPKRVRQAYDEAHPPEG